MGEQSSAPGPEAERAEGQAPGEQQEGPEEEAIQKVCEDTILPEVRRCSLCSSFRLQLAFSPIENLKSLFCSLKKKRRSRKRRTNAPRDGMSEKEEINNTSRPPPKAFLP